MPLEGAVLLQEKAEGSENFLIFSEQFVQLNITQEGAKLGVILKRRAVCSEEPLNGRRISFVLNTGAGKVHAGGEK